MHIYRTTLACAVAALSAVGLGVAGPTAASAAPGKAASASTSPVTVVKVGRDVDGDARTDTVLLEDLRDGKAGFRLTVVTARGVRASKSFVTSGIVDTGSIWQGTALFDDTPGVEIQLLTGFMDCGHPTLLTWRSNQLVELGGPDGGWINCADPEVGFMGSVFGRVGGKRSAEQFVLKPVLPGHKTFRGTATLYQWLGSSWKKLSSRALTVPEEKVQPYGGWSGVDFVK